MTLVIERKQIDRVKIVDDDFRSRDSYTLPVEELDLNAVQETGPVRNIDDFVQNTLDNSDAAICDYHLKGSNYSDYEGSELVAKLYDANFPAILCTRFAEFVDELRGYRRKIPVLVTPEQLTPDILKSGFETCIHEFNGKFTEERKPWRTLVRIVDPDLENESGYVSVVVPAWDNRIKLRVLKKSIPEEVMARIIDGHLRVHAHVNIGAEKQEDVYFDKWEPS